MGSPTTVAVPTRRGWWARLGVPWFARLMVVSFSAQFISSAIRPLITYEALAAGAGVVQVGIITASYSVLALFAAIPFGKAVDRRGETGFLLLGGFLVCAALTSLFAPANLILLAAGSALLGLGHLVMVVASQTVIAKGSRPDLRETRFATLTTVNSIAQIIAPAMTGFLVGAVNTRDEAATTHVPNGHVVVAVALGMAATATLTAISLRFRPGALAQRSSPQNPDTRSGFMTVLRLPAVPTAIFTSLTVLTAVDLLGAYLPVFGQAHGLSAGTVGLLLATEGVAAMVVRIGMLRLIARFTRRRLLIGSMVLAATGLAVVPLAGLLDRPEVALYGLMVLIGLGLGIGQPAAMAWVAAQTPVDLRGTAVSIRLSGNRLGQIAVPLATGVLAGGLGLAAAFWSPAVLLFVSAVSVFRTRADRPPETRRQDSVQYRS